MYKFTNLKSEFLSIKQIRVFNIKIILYMK